MSDEHSPSNAESTAARRRRLMLHRLHRPQHHDWESDEEEPTESLRRRIRKDPEWVDSEKEQYPDDDE